MSVLLLVNPNSPIANLQSTSRRRALHSLPPLSIFRSHQISNGRSKCAVLFSTHSALTEVLATAVDAPHPEAEQVLQALESVDLVTLMAEAATVRNKAHDVITFSPKVFIPLTRLCRDSCGYCTFAQGPVSGRRAFMTLDEVLTVAQIGARQGCTEALFTLGDKPELEYPEAAAELEAMGYSSTLECVAAAAGAVLTTTGLLPHINAGVMSAEDMRALRTVSVSQGLMLESTSQALLLPGGAHHGCPDKEPSARLAALEAAGHAKVPFTTGILVGIGETRRDRIEALLAIRECHRRHGHIQELIIQNFRAKKGTAMANAAEPSLEELLFTVAAARLIFGPEMNIQAPPNLTPEPDDAVSAAHGETSCIADAWKLLLDAGINDFGGVSPITRDFVNPEKPWPHLQQLAAATAEYGKALVPRLPIYPSYLQPELASEWLDGTAAKASPLAAALRHCDSLGFARASNWYAGALPGYNPNPDTNSSSIEEAPRVISGSLASTSGRRSAPLPSPAKVLHSWSVRMAPDGLLEGCKRPNFSDKNGTAVIRDLLDVVLAGHQPSEEEIVLLFSARGADFDSVCAAADKLRQRMAGDTVTYVINRNINYTNVCTYGCRFCAFSKGPAAEELRGAPYLLSMEEVSQRTAEAWARGATEVCMQGGIHPDFNGDTYLRILDAAKKGAPDIHVHAFSPLEVMHGATSLGWSTSRFLQSLRDAGLGSLPGTAAEVLDDSVRAELCPDKLSAAEWLDVIESAHNVGLKTTSTIMFGHVDTPAAWARHLISLRELQIRTGGLSEFVPLPFVHMEAPIYRKGRSRAGPTLRESILMHSIARLSLHPHVRNIQASWVKMGPDYAAQLLTAGCNDMGGTLQNESITRAAGAAHGQELDAHAMERLISAVGRTPQQRTTLYGKAHASSEFVNQAMN